MKKSIVLSLFVCLAMSLSVYAQDGAVVVNKADENLAIEVININGTDVVWVNTYTLIESPSGNTKLIFNATSSDITEGEDAELKKAERFERPIIGFGFPVGSTIDCLVTPALNLSCVAEIKK